MRMFDPAARVPIARVNGSDWEVHVADQTAHLRGLIATTVPLSTLRSAWLVERMANLMIAVALNHPADRANCRWIMNHDDWKLISTNKALHRSELQVDGQGRETLFGIVITVDPSAGEGWLWLAIGD